MANSRPNAKSNVLGNVRTNIGPHGSSSITLPNISSIIFQHNIYDGDIDPQVGSYTYTRTGSTVTASTTSSVSTYAADTLPMPSYRLRQLETGYGIQIESLTTNQLLYSQDLTNAAWTLSGATRSGDTQAAPDGTTTADTLTGANTTDYITQESAVTSVIKYGVFSVYLKAPSTSHVVIQVGDSVFGEVSSMTAKVTTSWQRFEVVKHFSPDSTGNMAVKIFPGPQSVYVWGCQLEQRTKDHQNTRHANSYVPTTSAEATSGAGKYVIPNSVITPAAAKGSISMWVNSNFDANNITSNGTSSYFALTDSGRGDYLALRFGQYSPYVFINNSISIGGTTAINEFGPGPNEWQHWLVTWDADDNYAALYVNGVLAGSSSGAFSDISFLTSDLQIGGLELGNTAGGDGIFSEVVMWSEELTASEVQEVYDFSSSRFAAAELGTGLLFRVNLGTSPVPITANNFQYWYEQRGDVLVDTNASNELKVDGDYTIGYPLGGYNKSGLQFHQYHVNLLTYSEALTNVAWTTTGVVVDSVSTYGTVALSSLTGIDGSVLSQASSQAAASELFIGSLYARVTSGTLDFDITIEGSSGGTKETYTDSFTATTTMQRFISRHNRTAFTGSATGNALMKVTLRGTGTLLLGGLQLERRFVGINEVDQYYSAGTYIKTTSSIKYVYPNVLGYNGYGHFNPNKGSVIAWINARVDNATDYGPSNGPTIWAAPGHSWDRWMTVTGSLSPSSNPTISHWWRNSRKISTSPAHTEVGVWHHVIYGWEVSGGTTTIRAWFDGALVLDATSTDIPSPRKMFFIGNDGFQDNTMWNAASLDQWFGLIDSVRIYGRMFSNTEALDDFNDSRAVYGR